MVLQEPKVEFVSIYLGAIATTGSICPSGVVEYMVGGGQRCIASQEEASLCDDWDTSIPW